MVCNSLKPCCLHHLTKRTSLIYLPLSSLKRLLDMLTTTTDWPINAISIPSIWNSPSGRVVLTGDAAHATVPYMALGAAMAVKDAAAMAAALRHVKSIDELPKAISVFVNARMPRVKMVHEASFANGLIIHLPDGPVQQARDEAMEAEVEGRMFSQSPDQWAGSCVDGVGVWVRSGGRGGEVVGVGEVGRTKT